MVFRGYPAPRGAGQLVLQDQASTLTLPATAPAEVLWIVEQGKIPGMSPASLLAAIDADPRITIYPLDRAVLNQSVTLTTIGEMHDRQIVATTLLLAQAGHTVALLTKDGNITTSGLVQCIW
jgi:hypothetical protein